MDIPNCPAESSSIKTIADALMRAKNRGVKIYVRAESKRQLPQDLKCFAGENSFAVNPVGCKFPALEICCDNREKTAGSLEICLSP